MTVDLRKQRYCDVRFDSMIVTYGLAAAIETWRVWDKKDKFEQGLLDWRLSGMTYKAIGAMCGMSPQKVGAIVAPLRHAYDIRCASNMEKIKAVLRREDPDYDYMTDRRTVTQEMFALMIGGQEVLNTLEQLSNLEMP